MIPTQSYLPALEQPHKILLNLFVSESNAHLVSTTVAEEVSRRFRRRYSSLIKVGNEFDDVMQITNLCENTKNTIMHQTDDIPSNSLGRQNGITARYLSRQYLLIGHVDVNLEHLPIIVQQIAELSYLIMNSRSCQLYSIHSL